MSPARIDPVRWRPPPAPARSRRRSGAVPLPPLTVIDVGGHGPEDVVVAGDGTVYTGTADGLIRRIRPLRDRPAAVDVVADVGQEPGVRPLGLEWLPDGRLLVCGGTRGLLAVDVVAGIAAGGDPAGLRAVVETLTDTVDGVRLRVCNNAAVDRRGTVWFTDSSQRFDVDDWRADVYEHRGTGRLLRRDPDGATHTLATGLDFANGVALLPDESAVCYAETSSYHVTKLWLTGERAGEREVLLENLPGFPDNLSVGDDGLLWVALASPRNRVVDLLAPMPPLVRTAVWRLPEAAQPRPKSMTWAYAVDPATGAVVHDLQGAHPGFGVSTGVREHRGRVWLGSLVGTTIASFPLPS